jgi:two-component system, OmpR family, phosphate regulon sensor histidine kinase PhoR
MSWLPRALVVMLAMLVGSLLCALVFHNHPQRLALALCGGALGVLLVSIGEAWRGQRLMSWLRGPRSDPAPRDAGFWGELGYRIEKLLRERDRALALEQQRLVQFLRGIEASPNGVLLLDADEKIEWCNAVAADHFGLDPVRDLAQRVTNLVRTPIFVSHLQAGLFDEPVLVADTVSRRTLSVLIRPYGDGLKLVLSQDITERERAEGMRRDFVANVSHEIRTPLTVLAGFVETMGSLPLSEVERRRVLLLMTQQTDRMQALVADLLTLAQLEGSPRPAPDRWVAVAPLMQRVQVDAAALSHQRHVLSFIGGDDAEIAGSDSELQSAIGNLVNNAVRYTPEGGQVSVRFAWRDDGSAYIEVADSGVGISREHIPRLTERFYRVDSSRSRETGGTGLGLSIVKHVVQRHGGEVDIDSEPGRGSIFRLTFPAPRMRRLSVSTATALASAAAQPAPAAPAAPAPAAIKVE